MRKALIPAAVIAAACVAAVVAQQREPAPDAQRDLPADQREQGDVRQPSPPRDAARDRGGEPRDATEPPRGSTSQRRPPPDLAMPPMEMGSRLELFLMRPGRMIIRDTRRVGRVECRPWENGVARRRGDPARRRGGGVRAGPPGGAVGGAGADPAGRLPGPHVPVRPRAAATSVVPGTVRTPPRRCATRPPTSAAARFTT